MKRFVFVPILLISLTLPAISATKSSDVKVSEGNFQGDSALDKASRKLIHDVQNDPERELRNKVSHCESSARAASRPFGRIDVRFNAFWTPGSNTDRIIVRGNDEGKSAYYDCMNRPIKKTRQIKKTEKKKSVDEKVQLQETCKKNMKAEFNKNAHKAEMAKIAEISRTFALPASDPRLQLLLERLKKEASSR